MTRGGGLIGPVGCSRQVAAAVVDFFTLAERRQSVGLVQGEELFDSRSRQDSLELRLAEIPGLSEILVMGDQPGDLLAFGVGEFERTAEPLGDPGPGLFVVMKGVTAAVQHFRRRFARVVQERGEGQGEAGIVRQKIENEHGVVPEVSFGLRRLALEQPFHRQERRQDGGDEACLEGQVHGLDAAGMHEHAPQLLGDPLGGNALDLTGHGPQGRPGRRLDPEPKPRRQTDRAQAAQLVFAQTRRRVADGSQNAVLQVGLAADDNRSPRRLAGP